VPALSPQEGMARRINRALDLIEEGQAIHYAGGHGGY
jgi:hypothetical protein